MKLAALLPGRRTRGRLDAIEQELARASARLTDYDIAWAAMSALPAAVGQNVPSRPVLTLHQGGAA